MFALACGASWFLYLHRYTWNVIAPYLEQDYGLSKTELGGIYSFFTPTYGLGQIPSGILCDWIGPHFFLGLIIGEASVGGFWLVVDWVLGESGNFITFM